MNGIRCPQCSVVNSISAIECRQCHYLFGNLPSDAFVNVPETDIFRSQSPSFQPPPPPSYYSGYSINSDESQSPGFQSTSSENATGRRTYFWYRMYCSALVVLYISLAVLGVMAMVGSYAPNVDKPQDAFNGGLLLLVLGGVFAIIFLIGVILSPKPSSWILGIILIALGMTSVCFLPFTLPLLIFWIKPETQRYFGRKK